MNNNAGDILVWLPSPMGDAILCTPALRAIRNHFTSAKITFFGNSPVRQILSPCQFNDVWLQPQSTNPFAIAGQLKRCNFSQAILFKNSFASALAVFLAGIASRVGYAREGRSMLLTDKLRPPRLTDGKFKPITMIDYYLAIASWLGADCSKRNMELAVDQADMESLKTKLPEISESKSPLVILVPGGAFGPSKCWPTERFAKVGDWLIDKYKATVIVSVAANIPEREIAGKICGAAKNKLINLGDKPLTLGQLKALFLQADLVISNDTGPRHIAIALQRKLITLFGPNDPAWTETGYENEIQLIGDVPCGPCQKPKCNQTEHKCMQVISVDMVCDAAGRLLESTD